MSQGVSGDFVHVACHEGLHRPMCLCWVFRTKSSVKLQATTRNTSFSRGLFWSNFYCGKSEDFSCCWSFHYSHIWLYDLIWGHSLQLSTSLLTVSILLCCCWNHLTTSVSTASDPIKDNRVNNPWGQLCFLLWKATQLLVSTLWGDFYHWQMDLAQCPSPSIILPLISF